MAKNVEKTVTSGKWENHEIGGETVRTFFPAPLPPEPALNLMPFQRLLADANQALGRLDGLATVLPDTSLFLYMYVRKEALLSSQIEGTQSSLSDLFAFEDGADSDVDLDDVQEVSNYVAAMDHGLQKLQTELPLSLRLIRDIHRILMSSGRGSSKQPGEFRKTQNWIGGTRPGNATYVTPPPEEMLDSLYQLESFLHADRPDLPVLVKAALAHHQFESIHPFLDGNGRLGRLLITFILCENKILSSPLLYLSLYLKSNRDRYYDLLQSVRESGDWTPWIEFFLQGVLETADQATSTASQILVIFNEDRQKIEGLGQATNSALKLHDHIQKRPVVNVSNSISTELDMSPPTVRKAISHLEELGILSEVTGKKRGKKYIYDRYMDQLIAGTEPLK